MGAVQWKGEWKALLLIVGGFPRVLLLACGLAPVRQCYQRSIAPCEVVCPGARYTLPHSSFFIAGAVGVFVSRNSVLKYLGPTANKVMAYGVASVSGTILAVCSWAIGDVREIWTFLSSRGMITLQHAKKLPHRCPWRPPSHHHQGNRASKNLSRRFRQEELS